MPIWPAFTRAMAKKELRWIGSTLAKLHLYFLGLVSIVFILSLIAKPSVSFWTSGKIETTSVMIFSLSVFIVIQAWNNMYATFLNGVGVLKVQLASLMVGAMLHIPVSYCLKIYFGFGPEGVVLSMCLSLSVFACAGPWQTLRLLRSLRGS